MKCDYCETNFNQFIGVVIYKKHNTIKARFCSFACAYNFQGERNKTVHDRREARNKNE